MRIISGKYGGRRLVSFDASHLRPTSDRVKESLFNILQSRCDEARILDLFGGTGNLSIEALSRGASHVDVVEKSQKSVGIIRKNLNLLNITEGIKIIKDDVFRFLKNFEGVPYDIIFIDPPFTEKIAHDVMQAVSQSAVDKPQALIAIESSSRERIDATYGTLVNIDSRDFGDKILSFFERKAT